MLGVVPAWGVALPHLSPPMSPLSRLVARLLAPTLLACAVPVSANQAVMAELAELSLEQLLDVPVSGASRLGGRRSDSPATISVISRQQIEALGLHTLADVLRSVPGVDITGDGTYHFAAVRGLYSAGDYNTRVLVLIDGNRINDNIYDQGLLGTEFPVDMALVERVEYIAGPGSAVYGANALFGVINIVTRAPGEQPGWRASLRTGNESQRHLGLSLDTALGDGRLLLGGSLDRHSGPPVHETWFGDAVASGTDELRRGNLFVRWDGGPWRVGLIGSHRVQGVPASSDLVFGDTRARYVDQLLLFNAERRHALGGGAEGSLRAFAGEYRFLGDYPIDYPPVTLNRDVSVGRWLGVEARLQAPLGESHRLVTGVEVQRQQRQWQTNVDVTPVAATYLLDDRQGWRLGIYADDQWTLAPDLHLLLGLRADREQGRQHLSPRVGAVWRPLPAWALKWQFGQAFREPNAYERWYQGDGPGSWRINPALHGERVRSDQFSLEWAEGGWRASSTVWLNQASGLTSLVYLPDADQYQVRNVGELTTRGLEGELEYVSGGDRYRLNASWSQVVRADQWPGALVYPTRMANASAQWQLPGDWLLATEALLRSRRGVAPGVGLLNAQLSTRLADGPWRLAIGGRNLADRTWYDPGPDEVRQPLVRGNGRQWWLSLSWEPAR